MNDYRELAERHKPSEEAAMALAARCLAHQGLTTYDIGAALNVHITAVDRMLTPACAELAISSRQPNMTIERAMR